MELEDIKKELDAIKVEEMTVNELRSVEETMRNSRLILSNSAQLIGSYKIAGNPTNCDLCSEIEETQSLLRALIYEQSGIYGDFARRLDKELRRRLSITQSILDAAKDFND
jgi:hypothetical protein